MLLALVLACAGCSYEDPSPEQLLANAKQARDKGQYKTAIIHLKTLLKNMPQNAEARYLLGITYNNTGDFKAGEVELRKALDLRYDLARVKIGKSLLMANAFQKVLDEVAPDPSVGTAVQAEILTLRAVASFGLGRKAEARQLLEQALAIQPEFPDALLAQSQIVGAEGKVDEALELVNRALAVAPKNEEAGLMKGDLLRFKSEPAEALTAYQKVLEISAENIPARVNITSLQIAAGNLSDARKNLEELRKTVPNLPATKYLIALVEFHQKKYAAARDAALQVLRIAPNHLPSRLLLGAVEFSQGAHAQAQSHLEQVLGQSPNNLYARRLLVTSFARTGRIQRAIEVLEPGLQRFPDDAQLMQLAGEVYLQANELDKAARYFERTVKLDPQSPAARTRLGTSRLLAGETDRALADFEAASQLDPNAYKADLLLVMSNLRRADYDEALKAAQSLEKKQPKNPLTYYLKGAAYVGKKDRATARKELEHALQLNPRYLAATVQLAELDLQDSRPEQARRRFEAVLEKDSNDARTLIALATISPRLGATSKQQIDWLERARKADPKSILAQLLLARVYASSGDSRKALEIAQQVQTAHPENAEVLDTLGRIQIGSGAKSEALTTYNKLVSLQPKSALALLRLANAQMANNDSARAIDTLRKAVALQPDLIEAQLTLAAMELGAGRFPAAMKIAQQMQKRHPKSPVGYVLEGDVLVADKKIQQAIKAYETAYGTEKSTAVVIKLHAAYTQAGKPEEAEERLLQWLKDSPDDTVALRYSAETSLKTGKYQYAIGQYERLLKTQPDNVAFLNNLAWAYQQVKDKRALETAERAYKLNPASAQAADTLGWILVEQGDTKRGIELLQRAVTAAPQDPENRYHLAQAFVKAGDRISARQELEKLVADSSGSPIGKEARQLLDKLR